MDFKWISENILIRIIVAATMIIFATIVVIGSNRSTEIVDSNARSSLVANSQLSQFTEKAENDPVAVFTAALAFGTLLLAVISASQIPFLIRADKTTQIAANAAKQNANAALAALARPWLTLEDFVDTRSDWTDCKGPLIAGFRVVNYETAPAFIISLKATYFLSPGPYQERSFPVDPLPDNIKKFPQKETLKLFINEHAVLPLIDRAPIDSARPLRDHTLERMNFDAELPITAGARTDKMFFVASEALAHIAQAIPIQTATRQYIIGQIIYEMPGQNAETITFCYEAKLLTGFGRIFGPPFNERNKLPD